MKTTRLLNLRAETRKDDATGRKYLDGVIPYNSRSLLISERGRTFYEEMAPSVFNRTLNANTDIKMLWNHNDDEVLGSRKAGTLTLENRADGLHFSCQLPAHAENRFETISRGDVDGTSFGFQVDGSGETWSKTDDGTPLRTVTAAHLLEVSPCTFPAYPGSSSQAAMRSMPGEEPPMEDAPAPEQEPPANEGADLVDRLKSMQEAEIELLCAFFGIATENKDTAEIPAEGVINEQE